MKNNRLRILVYFLVFLVPIACNSQNTHTIEITRIVPQTVVATQIVRETVVNILEPANVDDSLLQRDIDPDYFDGTIVITQYYTFLENGLYEQAYDLLSSFANSSSTKEEYIRMAALSFKSVQIVSVLPYFIAVEQQGGKVKPDPENKIRFAVQIRAWGEGNMSGSRMNGELQDLFLELVNENGGWRIDSFATAPIP